jgi:hypothetical protein
MRDHTRIEELLTLEALGATDATEREELRAALEEHGSCAECDALRAEITEAAGTLPFALEPVDVPPELETAVVERARTTPQEVRPRRRSVPLIAAGIAAALLLGVVLGANIRGGGSSTPDELAALLAEPGTQVVHMEGPSGNVAMAVSADGTRSYVAGTGLPALPDGKVYAVWSIAGDTPTSLVCLPVSDGSIGGGVDTSVAGADVVAITVEDQSCPSAPTTDPILTAPVS